MARVDVLLPTCDRPLAATMTLAGVAAQSFTDLRVIVADQNARPLCAQPTVAALARVIAARSGSEVRWHHRPARRGIAEQRQFLLERAEAPAVLYLDDDVLMEPWVLGALLGALERERCGFVGAFPAGLSFRDDVRPDQQHVEFWDGPVQPESLEPDSLEWERRRHLHRAANLYHASARHAPARARLYKVAWVASCVLYDRAKLLEVGGFSFWPRLPRFHSGEEVLVQNLLLRRYGGAALMPSGTYHAEEPSTVLNAAGGVDGHALALLPELAAAPVSPRACHG
jgi:glycosyltransferase involved in cell wall biosynthesis